MSPTLQAEAFSKEPVAHFELAIADEVIEWPKQRQAK
jgi:hypothetical protein